MNGDSRHTLVMLKNGSWTLKFLAKTIYMLMQDMFDPLSNNMLLSELYRSAKHRTPPEDWVLEHLDSVKKALLFNDNNVIAKEIADIILSSCLCDKKENVFAITPPFATNYCKI